MSSHRISRWVMQQCHSLNVPGQPGSSQAPHPWELGAEPIFHPFCSNPSPDPSQGWESPSGWQVGITAQYKHTQPGCPKDSGCIPPRDLLLVIPNNHLFPQPGLGCSSKHELEGHKAAFMSFMCSLHTSRGFPEQPQPWPHKRQGEDSEGRGPATTSCTHKAAKNSTHNGGPVWPWWH